MEFLEVHKDQCELTATSMMFSKLFVKMVVLIACHIGMHYNLIKILPMEENHALASFSVKCCMIEVPQPPMSKLNIVN